MILGKREAKMAERGRFRGAEVPCQSSTRKHKSWTWGEQIVGMKRGEREEGSIVPLVTTPLGILNLFL